MLGETFCGIAGIDMQADFLQEQAEEVASTLFMGEGKVMIISHNGIIAAVSGKPDDIGKHIRTVLANWEEAFNYVASGKEITENHDGIVSVFTPLKIDETTTPWSVHMVVPEDIVLAESKSVYQKMTNDVRFLGKSLYDENNIAIWRQSGVGAIFTLTALFIILWIARSIVSPIRSVITGVRESSDQVALCFQSDFIYQSESRRKNIGTGSIIGRNVLLSRRNRICGRTECGQCESGRSSVI